MTETFEDDDSNINEGEQSISSPPKLTTGGRVTGSKAQLMTETDIDAVPESKVETDSRQSIGLVRN